MSMLIAGVGQRLEDAGRLAELVGHADDRDLGLAAVVRDAGDDRLLHLLPPHVESVTQVPVFCENDERTWIGML